VPLADPYALRDVLLIEARAGKAQEIVALLLQQPLLHGRIAQQRAGRLEREQVAIEGAHQRVRVLLEERSQLL
jgi:hypothetical protein